MRFITDLTPEQRRENAIKAGKKSAEARQFKKTFRETFMNMNDKEGFVLTNFHIIIRM